MSTASAGAALRGDGGVRDDQRLIEPQLISYDWRSRDTHSDEETSLTDGKAALLHERSP